MLAIATATIKDIKINFIFFFLTLVSLHRLKFNLLVLKRIQFLASLYSNIISSIERYTAND